MFFWKKTSNTTSDEHLVKDPTSVKGRWENKPFSELASNRAKKEFTDYKAVVKRWNILRLEILSLFFKDLSVSRRKLVPENNRALATSLNTLAGAEKFNLFNKDLFNSLFRPFGPHREIKISVGQDILDALNAEAKSEGITVHDQVRRVLAYHVDAYPRCDHALELLSRRPPRVPPPANYIEPVLSVDQLKEIMFELQ